MPLLDETTELKRCNDCDETKSVDEFGFIKAKNNYRPTCKQCLNKRDRKRRYLQNNKNADENKLLHCNNCNLSKTITEFGPIKKSNLCKACRDMEEGIIQINKASGYKKCCSCNNFKMLDCFGVDKNRLDGKAPICNNCRKEQHNEKKDVINENRRERYKNDPEVRAKVLEQCKMSGRRNKDKIKKRNKARYKKNKEIVLVKQKKHRQSNKELVRVSRQKHYSKNKRSILDKVHAREKERMCIDPVFKLAKKLRNRLRQALNGKVKNGSAVRDLGCSVEALRQMFENMFYQDPKTGEAMCWEKYGYQGWHIDHIVPLSSFNLEDREQLLKACHYTNLRPLWAWQNLEKSDKLDWEMK